MAAGNTLLWRMWRSVNGRHICKWFFFQAKAIGKGYHVYCMCHHQATWYGVPGHPTIMNGIPCDGYVNPDSLGDGNSLSSMLWPCQILALGIWNDWEICELTKFPITFKSRGYQGTYWKHNIPPIATLVKCHGSIHVGVPKAEGSLAHFDRRVMTLLLVYLWCFSVF
jgi:hypothetical protein